MSLALDNDEITNSYQFFKANWLKEGERLRIENPDKQNLWSQVPRINITDELKANNEALEELRLAYKPFAQKVLYIDEFQNMGLSEAHLEKNLFIHYYGKNASGKNQYALVSKYEYTPIFKRHDSASTLFEEIINHKNLLLVVTLQLYNKEIIDENDFTFKIKKFKQPETKDLVGEGFEIKNNELTEFKYSGVGYPWIGFNTEINANSPLAYFYTKALLFDIGNNMNVFHGEKSDVATIYFKGQEAPVIFQTVNYTKFPKIGLQLYPNTDYNFNERMAFLKIIVSNQPIEIYDDASEINFTKNWTVFTFPIKIVQENIGNTENIIPEVFKDVEKYNKTVLWVYDDPYNKDNENIIKKLIENNYTVDHVKDTDTALSNLETTDYELIISDMGREKDHEAGLKFLIEFKKLNIETPFIIYTTTNNVKKYEKQALESGAFAVKTGRWEIMCEYFLGLLFHEVPNNRTMIVSLFSLSPSHYNNINTDIGSISQVFEYFKPSVVVKYIDKYGSENIEVLEFNRIDDFDLKNIIFKSPFLKELQSNNKESELFKLNVLKVIEASKLFETNYLMLDLFFKNSGFNSNQKITIVNTDIYQKNGEGNYSIIELISNEIIMNYDRLDLGNSYSLLVIPGYLNRNLVVDQLAELSHNNKVILITDFLNVERPNDALPILENGSYLSSEEKMSNVILTSNWILVRRKYLFIHEEYDLYLPPSMSLLSILYRQLNTNKAKIDLLFSDVLDIRNNLTKNDISNLESFGLSLFYKQNEKNYLIAKNLYYGENIAFRNIIAKMHFDWISKSVINFLNRQSIQGLNFKLKNELEIKISDTLERLKDKGIIENFKVKRFDNDPNNPLLIYLEIEFLLKILPNIFSLTFIRNDEFQWNSKNQITMPPTY